MTDFFVRVRDMTWLLLLCSGSFQGLCVWICIVTLSLVRAMSIGLLTRLDTRIWMLYQRLAMMTGRSSHAASGRRGVYGGERTCRNNC
jgi:hypothetical protein